MSRPSQARCAGSRDKSQLCASFNFDTFVLSSKLLPPHKLQQKQSRLPTNKVLTNNAVAEYYNKSNHTSITLITLSPKELRRLKYVRVPCLNKQTSIHIRKCKDTASDCTFIQLSINKQPKPTQIDTVSITESAKKSNPTHIIKACPNGMVFAVIFSTLANNQRFIIDGIYYHGHGAPVFKPDFKQRIKDERNAKPSFTNPFDRYILCEDNIIGSLRELRKHRKKRRSNINSDKKVKGKSKKRLSNNSNGEHFRLGLGLKSHSRSVSSSSVSSISSLCSEMSSVSISSQLSEPLSAIHES